uniref:Uncharacterized protein n=1 Tax=Vitis vinifera TaxID=29760 RepID=A5BJN5_VITVI|nr:hypothetical protein VITISV_043769 [Vitis vinifera]
MEAQKEDSVTSVEDSTNVKSELRKRGRPRKDTKEPPNKEKKEKTRCLTEIEEADQVEESTSGGVEVYAEEPAVTSPVTKGRRRPRKGIPRRAPL